MNQYTAGRIKANVSPPSPMWARFTVVASNGDEVEFSLHPDDVPDLAYVVQRVCAHLESKGDAPLSRRKAGSLRLLDKAPWEAGA